MAQTVQVVGLEQFGRNLSYLELQAFPNAAARAMNTTATTVRSETVRDVAKMVGLKQKDVRNRTSIRRATPDRYREGADVTFTGRPLNLIRFKPRQTKRGVSAAPGGRRRVFDQAFIVDLGRGQFVGIRRRRSAGNAPERAENVTRADRVGRTPIVGVVGPGIAETAADPEVAARRQDTVRRVFPERLERELAFYVSRIRR